MGGLADVRSIIAGTLDDVERIYQSQGVFTGVLDDLQAAQRLLWQRLHKEAARPGAQSATDRFTGARADATREHCRIVTEYLQQRIAGRTREQAEAAIATSLKQTVVTLEGLEQRFRGVTPNLRLREAATLHRTASAASGLWARSFPTSVDRYGSHMLGEFEGIIRAGIASGSTMDEMIGALTGHGGPKGTVSLRAVVTPGGVLRTQEADIPEGLFVRNKYWAERLVRTELARAYAVARQAGMEEQAKQFPDMRRKILAVLDKRTAKDSLAVHGQIRGMRENFVDGAGRSYLHPPARPNDRETVIPWRDVWDASAGNTSDWEKACMGELDQAGEDALFERMQKLTAGKQPKPRAPRKPKGKGRAEGEQQPPPGPPPPPPLPARLQKALDKLPGHFTRTADDTGFRGLDEFGRTLYERDDQGIEKAKIFKLKEADLEELLAKGRIVPTLAHGFRVVDSDKALPFPELPPMQLPRTPTIQQEIEAEVRSRIKTQFASRSGAGRIELDGEEFGSIYQQGGKFVASKTWRYRGASEPTELGQFDTQMEAMRELRAAAVVRAAEAASCYQRWDHDSFKAAVAAGDTTTARQMIRGLLWQEGVLARDPIINTTAHANQMVLKTDAEMPDARAWHSFQGHTAMRTTVWEEAASRDVAKQQTMLRTFVHEELHGSSRETASAYAGAGAAIEEVSVEMAARKIAGKVFGTEAAFNGIWGSYQHKINEVRDKLANEFPQTSYDTIRGWLADTGLAMRAKTSRADIAKSPADLVEQFVDALPLPATLPNGYTDEAMRRNLRMKLRALTAP